MSESHALEAEESAHVELGGVGIVLGQDSRDNPDSIAMTTVEGLIRGCGSCWNLCVPDPVSHQPCTEVEEAAGGLCDVVGRALSLVDEEETMEDDWWGSLIFETQSESAREYCVKLRRGRPTPATYAPVAAADEDSEGDSSDREEVLAAAGEPDKSILDGEAEVDCDWDVNRSSLVCRLG
eukprot:116339-Hanusia_phi.AAC.1